jgi:hypothetical protein
LGAVPSEVGSSDGSETVNGDAEDETRMLAREADRLAAAVANAVFEQDEEKIKVTSTEGRNWIATQSQVHRTARVRLSFVRYHCGSRTDFQISFG